MIDRGERMETFPGGRVVRLRETGDAAVDESGAAGESTPRIRTIEGVVVNEPVYIAPTAVLCELRHRSEHDGRRRCGDQRLGDPQFDHQ